MKAQESFTDAGLLQGRTRRRWTSTTSIALLLLTAGCANDRQAGLPASQVSPAAAALSEARLSELCTPEAMQAVAAKLPTTRVSVEKISNGAFGTATKFIAAKGDVPAFCQVSGSFVTNPQTGKTANFLATFPANWNGKYLQIGCSGHCGQFYVSNPAMPSVIVTTQGQPNQIIKKGYAAFATDEGHKGMGAADWAVRKDGSVDQDYLDDFYYRSHKVLADLGKEFTKAFYANAQGSGRAIARSYFAGCSGGGRDALVASSYFPEKFDGIIAGSPYDPVGMGAHSYGLDQVIAQSPAHAVPASLYGLLDRTVKAQCDAVDGVKDGIIQNPLACNFRPDRDLPLCDGDKPGEQCFTGPQIKTLSAALTAMTDGQGNVLQPGFSVSELIAGAGVGYLGSGLQKVFVHRNDPAFDPAKAYTFQSVGAGQVNAYRVVFQAAEYARIRAAIAAGAGHLPENMHRLIKSGTKLMLWHNWSDERLSPVSSINYYHQLARQAGGLAKIQKQARMFMLPGTAHCSITGIGPNQFDALSAMENWVENGQAPNELLLRVANHQFTPGAPPAEALKFPNWTVKVCKYPELARYSGTGDVKDAANWSCSPKDKRGLEVGESGRQVGVLH